MNQEYDSEKIKAVFWDLDGTILNTTELILGSYRFAFKKILARELNSEEVLINFGRPLSEVMNEYSKEKANDLVDSYREYNIEKHDDLIVPFPGIYDAIANTYRRGFKQAIVTSKTEWLSDHGLKLFDLRQYFETIVGVEATEKHKPCPEPLIEAMRLLEVESSEAIYIGDSIFDAKCADGADVLFASAEWGPNSVAREKITPKWRLDDPRDILRVLPSKRHGLWRRK